MGKRNVYVWGLLAVGGLAVGAGLSMLSGRGPYDAEEVRGTLFAANPGLKKVLDFYEGDSLKHAAALYLIDNLGYHEGVDSADLRGLYRAYELFATGHYSYEQAMDSAARAYGTAGARDVRMRKDVYIAPPVEAGSPLYLCMSTRLDWKPVACIPYDGREARFPDCHGGTVYCLATYDAGHRRLQTVSHPFSVDVETGAMAFRTATGRRGDVVLLSKFGMIGEFFLGRMVGGVFEGSQTPDFRRRDTLHLIREAPSRLVTQVRTDTARRYRYVRYFGPYKGYCNISEVAFYGSPSDSLPLQGTVIGPERGAHGDHSYFMAMDGQTDTSYDHPTLYDGWVGLDLGARKAVGRIAYSPRHRDNFVRSGDTYELFVCEGGEWKSAGTQVAQSDSLLYHDIPLDAFLLLKNHTRGVDERIFEYKDGRQKFW